MPTITNGASGAWPISIDLGAELDQIASAGGGQLLSGTADADTLTGTALNDHINGGSGDDVLFGGGGDDIIDDGAGHDRVDGGDGLDTLILSGGRSDYVLLQIGSEFLLKGPDGGSRLTNMEMLQFGDGRSTDLRIQYGPDGWGALVDHGYDDPQVLPALGGKGGDDHLPLPDGPLVLPGLAAKAFDDEPLVLPGAGGRAGRFALTPEDAGLVVMGPHGPHLLDVDLLWAGTPHDPWA